MGPKAKGIRAIGAMAAVFALAALTSFTISTCTAIFTGAASGDGADGGTAPNVTADDENATVWSIDLSLPRMTPYLIDNPASLSVIRQTIIISTTTTDPKTKKQTVGWCTGFMLRPGLAVTMAHCIHDPKEAPPSVLCDERTVEPKILAIDKVRDLALLEADCKAVPLMLNLKRPRVDEPLRITGFDFGADSAGSGPFVISAARYLLPTSAIPGARITLDECPDDAPNLRAHVRAMNRRKIPRDVALSGLMRGGNSGSAVFRENGEIAGILMSISTGYGRSYMVPAYSISRLLETSGIKLK